MMSIRPLRLVTVGMVRIRVILQLVLQLMLRMLRVIWRIIRSLVLMLRVPVLTQGVRRVVVQLLCLVLDVDVKLTWRVVCVHLLFVLV